ncbi:hypothetical protein IMCC1989_1909 [gamma proteobacterium IMCC1989]|nr:hypothetical protein IMCC1989_1909 [gamma proteobacterium IMCC1989]
MKQEKYYMKHYQEHGYVVLRNFFTDTELNALAIHVDRIYDEWSKDNAADIYQHKLVNMHSLTSPEYFEAQPDERIEFFEAIASKKLTTLLEELFGSGIYFHNTQLFFNPSNSERLPYWHRDMQYSPIADTIQRAELHNILSLHVRIPLLSEKGVELIAGTHQRWDTELEHNIRLEKNNHKNSEPLPNATLIDLSPRDILIFNAQMIHRGNYAQNPSRKALDLCVGKYHPMTAEHIDETVLPSESEIVDISNNEWYRVARDMIENTIV